MLKFFKHLWNNNKIRKKLVAFFILTTLLMGITSFYTYYNARVLMLKMNNMFMSNIFLNGIYEDVNKVELHLENYLFTKHSESLKEYIKCSNELNHKADVIKREAQYDENGLMLKDIGNMINTYLEQTDEAVNAKRGRKIKEYIAYYNEANRLYGYINLYIKRLNIGQLQENTKRYMKMESTLNYIQIVNLSIIVGSVVFNIILIIWFSFKITKPIINLSRATNEISAGNFDVEQVIVDTDDEISVMAGAFNRMTSSIREYINQIREKAQLEGRLKEQEMQNLVMKNLLREAELHALQSQINPHFIFNTLNAGAQIAMLENADRACVFMENVANLLRYSMRKLDRPATLREEVVNINSYIYVLKARFADRIEFVQGVDESILDITMPCMILQPLVENAFIHGISEMENGGRITLRGYKAGDRAFVEIEDNGKGIDAQKLECIMNGENLRSAGGNSGSGHTTGIGLNNVISRLKIFFKDDNVIDIVSNPGRGTRLLIKIPFNSSDSRGE